jgi:hypothetical protein
MAGVQIHHPEVRDAIFVFELGDKPYPVPYLCSTCNTTHMHKAVHLRFDALGDCVVAEETWDVIKDYLNGVVTVGKTIPEPEPMTIGMNGHGENFQVVRMED